jgi:predicted nucleic acid-binding protein
MPNATGSKSLFIVYASGANIIITYNNIIISLNQDNKFIVKKYATKITKKQRVT